MLRIADMRIPFVLRVVALATMVAGCSVDPAASATTPAVYRLDLGAADNGRSARFTNESLAFRPDLVTEVVTEIARDGDRLRKVYNRLPCQGPPRSAREDEDMAIHGFRQTENMASARPVRLESISLDMPDSDDAQPGLPDRPVTQICFAYHTKDGRWHGRLEPVKTVHDNDAKMSRVTLEVGASDVDIVGVVVYSGFVSMLSYVARPE